MTDHNNKNDNQLNVTKDGFSIRGIMPMIFFLIFLFIIIKYSDDIALVVHGDTFKTGKTNSNGLTSNSTIIGFWTPIEDKTINVKIADEKTTISTDGTHTTISKFYRKVMDDCNSKLLIELRYSIDCKKLQKRSRNGYYHVTGSQIKTLENELFDIGATGFNRYFVEGSSKDSINKPGYWWNVTFPRSASIDSKLISKIVNRAFKRGTKKDVHEKNSACDFTYDSNKPAAYIDKCENQYRIPRISVYAEIKR